MKVTDVIPIKGEIIETDEDLYNRHIRWSADNWETIMGESTETTYDCDELEFAYQEYINKIK